MSRFVDGSRQHQRKKRSPRNNQKKLVVAGEDGRGSRCCEGVENAGEKRWSGSVAAATAADMEEDNRASGPCAAVCGDRTKTEERNGVDRWRRGVPGRAGSGLDRVSIFLFFLSFFSHFLFFTLLILSLFFFDFFLFC